MCGVLKVNLPVLVFINRSFGIGKTTVARILADRLPKSAVFDPEPIGLVLSRMALGLPLSQRTDDFQDLVSWRRTSVQAIRFTLRFQKTVIVPMTLSNLSYLGEFLSHFRGGGVPTLHFCVAAPHRVVLERLRSREEVSARRNGSCEDPPRVVTLTTHRSLRNTYQQRIIRRLKPQMKYWSAFIGLGGLLLLASLSLLHQRGLVEERPASAQPADAVAVPTRRTVTEGDALAEHGDGARESTSIDLRSASQTFRNSTLLFAIRRAGFYCADVMSAHESADGVWVASCSDLLGYIVTLRGLEQFDVHPVAQYFDSVAPVPVDPDRSLEPRSLEPQPLRK